MPVKPVVITSNPDEPTDAERRKALETVNPIKEKINVIFRGRTCANGSKQKMYLKREKVWHHQRYFYKAYSPRLLFMHKKR